MNIVATFFLLCGIAVTVHAQWNPEWSWDSGVFNPQNRPQFVGGFQNQPQPGGRPENRPQPRGRPQIFPEPAPAPVPAPDPDPAPAPAALTQVDGNGQLIGCPCVTTHETNVVCGTDGNTYGNMGKLRCAQRCIDGLELNYIGVCQPLIPRPDPIIPSQ